jgi:uncharacterized protein YndB with AHSA1/START domain
MWSWKSSKERSTKGRSKEMVAMTSSGTAVVTLPADTQIVITREFDAPKHLVYRAYTEPELIERWWSGERGEVTSVDVDLRVGGTWRYVMRANEGFEVAFHGEFREIVPNERLVTTEVFEMPDDFPLAGTPEAEEGTLNTITFTEVDGRTTLTTVTECHTKEVRDAIIDSGMEGGMQEAMDRLEQVAVSLG